MRGKINPFYRVCWPKLWLHKSAGADPVFRKLGGGGGGRVRITVNTKMRGGGGPYTPPPPVSAPRVVVRLAVSDLGAYCDRS